MAQGRRLAIAGILIGLGAAYAAGRAVATSVYGMRPADPLILTTAIVVVAAISLVATVIPAARAIHVEPLAALRAE